VQPLGGFNALFEVFTALIAPSSRVMTPQNCALSETHSGVARFFNVLKYDSSSLDALATNYKPHLIVSGNGVDAHFNNGGSAWDYDAIGSVAKKVGAYHLVDISDSAGLTRPIWRHPLLPLLTPWCALLLPLSEDHAAPQ